MKIGMVFPGYGNQYVGMGKAFHDHSRVVQEYFEEASNCLDMNFIKLCFATSEIELSKIENAYLSIFLISTSIGALLKQHGIIPSVVLGCDLGEYAAAYTAGGISFPDALYLVKKYSQLYQDALQDTKYEVIRTDNYDEVEIKFLCEQFSYEDDKLYIAVYEDEKRFKITGSSAAIKRICDRLGELTYGSLCKLSYGGGLHSPLMDEVTKNVKTHLEKIDFKDTNIQCCSSVIAQFLDKGEAIKASLIQQIHAPIYWLKVVGLCEMLDVIILVGPGTKLKEIFFEKYSNKQIFTINTIEDFNDCARQLGAQLMEVIHDEI